MPPVQSNREGEVPLVIEHRQSVAVVTRDASPTNRRLAGGVNFGTLLRQLGEHLENRRIVEEHVEKAAAPANVELPRL
jgi:hypothetical protein